MILKEAHCIHENLKKIDHEARKGYLAQIDPSWSINDSGKLTRNFPFENFKKAIAFVNELAVIAEREQHHPDICIRYNEVSIELSTHDVGGLSVNDFILAAKLDEV